MLTHYFQKPVIHFDQHNGISRTQSHVFMCLHPLRKKKWVVEARKFQRSRGKEKGV